MNKKLRIYLKENEYLKKNAHKPNYSSHRCIAGRVIMDDAPGVKGAHPYIDMLDDEHVIARLKKIEDLSKFFIKAILADAPSFPTRRECGIYKFGLATAELTSVNNHYLLKIESFSLDGLPDILELRRLLWEGDNKKAKLVKSYEKTQKPTWRTLFNWKPLAKSQKVLLN